MTYPDGSEQLTLAHGINEELTIILNSVLVAARLIGAEHPALEPMVDLKHSAIRCAELTRRLGYHC
jgi:hypothetical protein